MAQGSNAVVRASSGTTVLDAGPCPSTSQGPTINSTPGDAPRRAGELAMVPVHVLFACTRLNLCADRVTLRLVPRRKKKDGVRWTDDTVDNEGMGRRSSKKCCIYHRKRAFGDWSDDEDSDAECDCPQPDSGGIGPDKQPAKA
eukprot:scaffold433836_cov55-Prasinocladus_malaysianus.AAC.1